MCASGEIREGQPVLRRRRLVGILLAVLALAAILLAVPRIAVSVSLQMASGRMSECEFGPAQGWLAWSAWLSPGDYRTDLLQATCHRNLREREKWHASLQEAERKRAPKDLIELEMKLGRFQSGQVEGASEADVAAMVAAGASLPDVGTAILEGYLERGATTPAKAFLEALPGLFDAAQADYLWGMIRRKERNLAEAETRLNRALDARPGHEPARAELADLFEEKGQLRAALEQYVELAARGGRSEAAITGISRVLRKQGRLEEAQAVLAPLAARLDPGEPPELELAQIALEAGDCEQAGRRLGRLRPETTDFETIASPAMIVMSLQGRGADAQRLFDVAAERRDRSGWFAEVQSHAAVNSAEPPSADVIRRLGQRETSSSQPLLAGHDAERPGPDASAGGGELYAAHCSVCHGAKGNGRGRAARYLFPRPRHFGAGGLQMAGTRNGVASLEDVEKVLARGMAGTSMQAFDKLSRADRRLLAQEVLRLRREGAREEIARALREAGEEPVEVEVREAAERTTTPGPPIPLPGRWPRADQAVAKGKACYLTLGCAKCHGDDGIGAADQSLFDDQGEPNRPRDLIHEPFKGGRDRESIYLRIAAGMPGTAHPAAPGVPEEQLAELVEYVLSLARQPHRVLTNDERRAYADAHTYREWPGRQ